MTYSNAEGSQTLTGVATEQGFDFMYEEAGGYSAGFVLSDDGTLTIGELTLSGVETGVFGTQHTLEITLTWRGQAATTTITVDELTGGLIGTPNLDGVRDLIYGQVSLDLDDNLVAASPEFEAAQNLDSFLTGGVGQNAVLKSWDCAAELLGGLGTGAALALGCGGGYLVVGPYSWVCCGGAIALYGRSLIKIARTC